MIKVIYNSQTDEPVYHLQVDGRVFEECNTDQLEDKVVISLVDFIMEFDIMEFDIEDQLCERCFSLRD